MAGIHKSQQYTFGTIQPRTGLSKRSEHPCCHMYKMDSPTRGLAVIVNNLYDDGKAGIRDASNRDVANLTTLFKYLGYEVDTKEGLDKLNMIAYLQDVAQRDHSNYDSFVCCILSHGSEGGKLYYGASNEPVQINDMIDNLNGEACKTLKGKPKIFFVNACRGSMAMIPAPLGPPVDTADFLFCYSTTAGFYAFAGSSESGSYYIQEICKIITEHATYASLVDMMAKVCENVGSLEMYRNVVQAPEMTSRLTKLVHFF